MAIIDMVKWDGNSSILAWKFPSEELSTWTQLIVNETQEAYLVKEGVYQGPFGAGRHTLSTSNIPLISGLIGLPFGGKSPFTAEVWYVNKISNLDIKWGTPDPIQLKDPKYDIMIPVRSFGQYGIKITDPKKFLLKLVGTLSLFNTETLSTFFNGVFTTKIKTGIASAIIKNGHSILEISTELNSLSNTLKELLLPEMEEYGVGLTQFNIHSINVPEDDPAVITLKTSLAKRAEMSIIGFNYQQERSFDTLQIAAGNEGSAGSLMGAGLGMGMGVGMGASMGNAFTQISPLVQPNNLQSQLICEKCNSSNSTGTKFCGNCGFILGEKPSNQLVTCDKCNASITMGSKFCPSCGDVVNACPSCGEDNASGTKQCRRCGTLMPTLCPSCNSKISGNAKFCTDCGFKIVISCKKCGTNLSFDMKFCNACGELQQ